MNIASEQVFIVNTTELDQQNQHIATLQRAFMLPGASLQSEETLTSMCLLESMDPPSRNQTCRLCATVTELVVPIFEGEGLQNNLADKIHQHLPIKVSESDHLPVVMCFQCTSTLLAWHELVVCSVQADSIMRERFNVAYSHQQHQQQQEPHVQHSQSEIKDEKWSRRGVRACVRCEHCAGYFPDTHLRAHLLAAHAPLLFVCAECHLYRNRGDMIAHMTTHIKKTKVAKLPEATTSPNKQSAPKTIIPVVRLQRLSRLAALPPLVETSSLSIPLANNQTSSSSLVASQAIESPLQKTQFKTLETHNTLQNQLTAEPTGIGKEYAESANETNPSEQQSTNDRNLPKDMEKTQSPLRSNDFSDHSDPENDFGRLPESVFDAIEDSQDGNDGQDISETEKSTKKPNLPRPCPVCEKQCNSVSGWYYHLKHAHSTDKNFACDSCNKVFAEKSELAIHIRTHMKDKPFECRSCSSKFSCRAGRYIHEQTHLDRRVHICSRCPRAFRWRAQLNRHETRHDSAKQHVCPQCGRGFSVASDLLRHVRSHSPGSHRCDICNATFKQKRYLKVHMVNLHLAISKTCKEINKLVAKSSTPDKSPPLPSIISKDS